MAQWQIEDETGLITYVTPPSGGGTASGTVVAETVGGAGTAGVSTAFQRGDHVHAMPAATESNYVANDNTGAIVSLINADTSAAQIASAKVVGGSWPAMVGATTYFKVYQSGTTTYAKDTATGVVAYSGTVASTVINDIISAATKTVVIELDPHVTVDAAAVSILKPGITLFVPQYCTPATGVTIPSLTMTDASVAIKSVLVWGVVINQLNIMGGLNGVSYNALENCAVLMPSGATGPGVTMDQTANGTAGPGIQYTDFTNCWFNDQNTDGATVYPMFEISSGATNNTTANGHAWLVNCHYVNKAAAATLATSVFHFIGPLVSGPPLLMLTNFDCVTQNTAAYPLQVFWFDQSIAGNMNCDVLWTEGYIETQATLVAPTKKIIYLTSYTGASGNVSGKVICSDIDVEGSSLYLTNGTPRPAATVESGVEFRGHSATASALLDMSSTTYGTGVFLSPTGVVQGTGSTNATVGAASGLGTWRLKINFGGPGSFDITTPIAPGAGIYLANLFPYPVEVNVTAPGTAGACSIIPFANTAAIALAVPVAGTRYRLEPGDKITFATAWPTMRWQGVS